ncbi:MAG TPA: hypothetical protein VMF32_01970 [Xanthobacteraceae bacterium]|nr:hypothetical protein [Xanthobacteraceae bacterium]
MKPHLKTLCCLLAAATALASVPAMAQQFTGGGTTSIWSSAQGTSDSYGNATGFATSQSGSMTDAGGLTLTNLAGSISSGSGAITGSFTSSNAGASTNGNGYAQVQTSGYAGGSVSGFSTRTH